MFLLFYTLIVKLFLQNTGGQGAAIAPPASLDESSEMMIPIPVGKPSSSFGGIGGSVAAKIMAKYGFKVAFWYFSIFLHWICVKKLNLWEKFRIYFVFYVCFSIQEGQGLGKSQQGIVRALEVEKTSKRGGRIVSDAEEERMSPPPPQMPNMTSMPPPPCFSPKLNTNTQEKAESNIADILRNPSKVSLLRVS